jgi:hypothetical protein
MERIVSKTIHILISDEDKERIDNIIKELDWLLEEVNPNDNDTIYIDNYPCHLSGNTFCETIEDCANMLEEYF